MCVTAASIAVFSPAATVRRGTSFLSSRTTPCGSSLVFSLVSSLGQLTSPAPAHELPFQLAACDLHAVSVLQGVTNVRRWLPRDGCVATCSCSCPSPSLRGTSAQALTVFTVVFVGYVESENLSLAEEEAAEKELKGKDA